MQELLHGEYPLSGQEYLMWLCYFKYKAEEEEKAGKKGSKDKGKDSQAGPTMGQPAKS